MHTPDTGMPPLRFFTAAGRLSRRDFALTLGALFGGLGLLFACYADLMLPLVCGAAPVILWSAVYFVVNPLCMVLISRDIIPYGVYEYILLLAAVLYPLAALPLVLRRLRTLGRSAAEALLVYAALLPAPILSVPIADFLAWTERMQPSDAAHRTDLSAVLTAGAAAPDSGAAAAVPLIYCTAVSFFRDMTAAFWVMLVGTWFIACAAVWFILSVLAVPAVIRRLHDMNCGGWLALPIVPGTLVVLCLVLLTALLSVGIAATVLTDAGLNGRIAGPLPPNDMYRFLAGAVVVTGAAFMVLMPLLCLYAAWLFFRKGSPGGNRFGPPPINEKLPPVRAAFFSMRGTIERGPFILRSLVLFAAAGAVLPCAAYLITVPLSFILIGLGALPVGAYMYGFSLVTDLYPLALLPLVLRRLRTLGRSPYEAAFIFAALVPGPFVLLPLSEIFGTLQFLPFARGVPLRDVVEPLIVAPTDASVAFAAFSFVCAAVSIIGIIRLVRK